MDVQGGNRSNTVTMSDPNRVFIKFKQAQVFPHLFLNPN